LVTGIVSETDPFPLQFDLEWFYCLWALRVDTVDS
jgi:hypothetical protein